jgi:hypothetical protein
MAKLIICVMFPLAATPPDRFQSLLYQPRDRFDLGPNPVFEAAAIYGVSPLVRPGARFTGTRKVATGSDRDAQSIRQ